MFIKVTEIRENIKFCEESEFETIQQYINSDIIKIIYPSNRVGNTSIQFSDGSFIYVKEKVEELCHKLGLEE
jgi:uncharacterized protein YlzI (FlbEa/FlbD family)